MRSGSIESRRVATNAAILQAIAELDPASVLDVGCGEGWLVRALGPRAHGVDRSAPLIEAARALGGSFAHLSYRQLAGSYEALVCNFSLLEEELPLAELAAVLAPGGRLFIQTLHPWTVGGTYQDEPRLETFGGQFPTPMPWYFRTLQSWVACLTQAGFQLLDLREPRHPDSGQPLSLLFICGRAGDAPNASRPCR